MGALRSQTQTDPKDRVVRREALRAELAELALTATRVEVLHDAALRVLMEGLPALAGWLVELDSSSARPRAHLCAERGPMSGLSSPGEWIASTSRVLRGGVPAMFELATEEGLPEVLRSTGAVRAIALPLTASSGAGAVLWLACEAHTGGTQGAHAFADAIARTLHLALARLGREQALIRFRQSVDLLPDGILVMRADGRLLDANETALAVYGYSREELLALSILDLRAGATLPEVLWQMRRAGATGLSFNTFHRRKDGTEFPCEVRSRGAILDGEHVLISVLRSREPDPSAGPR